MDPLGEQLSGRRRGRHRPAGRSRTALGRPAALAAPARAGHGAAGRRPSGGSRRRRSSTSAPRTATSAHACSISSAPRGVVHAFEPNPVHHPRLQTIARTGPAVAAPGGAVGPSGAGQPARPGPRRTRARWPGLPGAARGRRGAGGAGRRSCAWTTSIGDEVRVAFIKCDVEGHEDAVMRGARRLLARDRPPVLVEIEQRHRSRGRRGGDRSVRRAGLRGLGGVRRGLRPVSAVRPRARSVGGRAPGGAGGHAAASTSTTFCSSRPGSELGRC